MGQSEVARIREQIELEYEAMMRGMHGFAQGTARHTFIVARMSRVEQFHSELTKHVDEEEATDIIVELYNEATK